MVNTALRTAHSSTTYDTLVKEEDYSYNWYDGWTDEDWSAVTFEAIPEFEIKS